LDDTPKRTMNIILLSFDPQAQNIYARSYQFSSFDIKNLLLAVS